MIHGRDAQDSRRIFTHLEDSSCVGKRAQGGSKNSPESEANLSDTIRELLQQHPLRPGDGRETGFIICDGCHLTLGDPVKHLHKVLAEALDPDYARPEAPQRAERPEYRESYLDVPVGRVGE